MKNNFDVIIVGGDIIGLTLANLMAMDNISILVLDKKYNLYHSPRAVSVDYENIRVWQTLGILNKLYPFIQSCEKGKDLVTYKSASGKTLTALQQHDTNYGYLQGYSLLQHEVEKVLKRNLRKYPKVTVLFNHNVSSFKEINDNVFVKSNSNGETFNYKCKYMVGCDGEDSLVRRTLGIDMKGFTYKNPWLLIDAIEKSKKLKTCEVFCDYKRPNLNLPLAKHFRRFEFMLKKGEKEEDFLKDEKIEHLICKHTNIKIEEIERKMIDVFEARLAKKYSKGRVFLAGDSAHIIPPFGGQALSSGLRDVSNLSWKLSSVIRNKWDKSILKTYEQERRPHQKKMNRLSVILGLIFMPKNALQMYLQNGLLYLVSNVPYLKKKFEVRGENLQPVYKKGAIRKGNLAGHFFPQPVINGEKLDYALGYNFAVVIFGGEGLNERELDEVEFYKRKGSNIVFISPEHEKEFKDLLDLSLRHFIVVRPDRFIYKHLIREKDLT